MFKAPPDLRAGRMLGMQPELLCPRRSRFAHMSKLKVESSKQQGKESSVEAKKPGWLFQRSFQLEIMKFQAVCQGNEIPLKMCPP
jgi:hypothetical protein